MNTAEKIGILGLCALAALTVFHLLHHLLYCRYRNVPGKSHCAVCGHRRICRKVHHRK